MGIATEAAVRAAITSREIAGPRESGMLSGVLQGTSAMNQPRPDMSAAETPATSPAASSQDPTRRLLQGPIAPTLLRLALPNVGEAGARIAFIACDAVFVGWLGTEALAAVALVFPLFLVVQMISAGGLGSGVAAAIARALGAGDQAAASRIAMQGLLMAVLSGLAVALVMLLAGPALYAALGAEGATLQEALLYSGLVFGGGLLVWLMNISANILRGTGNMLVPARAIVVGEIAHLVLSPVLILGLGPFPALGVVGAAIGVLAAYGLGAGLILLHLGRGRSVIRFTRAALRVEPGDRAAILKVGLFSGLNILQFQITTVILTGYVAHFGATTLAGFGAALRLELLQIPLIFAFGSAIITMTASNLGAGQVARVAAIARLGLLLATGIGLGFAALAGLAPGAWMALFTDEAAVAGAGTHYLVIIALTLPLSGLGLGGFFVCMGIGKVGLAFAIGTLRLVLIAALGALALRLDAMTPGLLYLATAAVLMLYGIAMGLLARRVVREAAGTA